MNIEKHIEIKIVHEAEVICDPTYTNVNHQAFWWFHDSLYILYHYRDHIKSTHTQYTSVPLWVTRETYKIAEYCKERKILRLDLINEKLVKKLKTIKLSESFGI